MKKCPYCGLENSDELQLCRVCQTDLNPPEKKPADFGWVRRILPYILSFIIVTTSAFLYNQSLVRHGNPPLPKNTIILQTSLSEEELIAKMAEIGVPRDKLLYVPYQYSAGAMYARYIVTHTVMFLAFGALVWLFVRMFRNNSLPPNPDPEATGNKARRLP